MLGIIAYGSLINSQEIEKQHVSPSHSVPIKLETFKRSFNQRPAWRKDVDKHSAVLNVEADNQSWINGVCYCYPEFDFDRLDKREKGYSRTTVTADIISCYQGYKLPELEKIFVYLGKTEYQSNILLPNPDYLQICLTGAKSWGNIFFHDFLNTTYINNGILLRDDFPQS